MVNLRQILVILLATIVVGGCGSKKSITNILLLTLDTTRADALSCYGEPLPVTPHLDQLARNGVRFDRAYAPTPVTLPSHSTILTGTYPVFHGARGNGGYWLDPENVTLAEILSDQGFQTAAFVASFPLHSRYGTNQGFDVYDDDFSRGGRFASYTYPERKANHVIDSASLWYDGQRDPEKPFFAWLHFFDPHGPHEPPQGFAGRFDDAYLEEIAFMDAEIGRFLDKLKEDGVLEETLVIVVADHGEGRNNPHDEPGHGIYIYDETVRVPFILAHHSLPQERAVENTVTTADIVPTILELLSLPGGKDVQGRSLLSMIQEGKKVDSDDVVPIYLESLLPYDQFGWSPLSGVCDGEFKYIRAPRSELYRMSEDPKELQNLAASHPDEVSRLEGLLGALREDCSRDLSAGFGRVPSSSQEAQALEALGYVQARSGNEWAREDPVSLALSLDKDPKDLIQSYLLVEEGRELQRNKNFPRATIFFRDALKVDSENIEALGSLGLMALHRKDFDEMERIYRKVVEIAPRNGLGLYGLAYAIEQRLAAAGQDKDDDKMREAEVYYVRAVEADSYHLDARLNLGIRYFRTERFDRSAEQFQAILAIEPNHKKANRNLAAVLIAQNRDREARDQLIKVLKLSPDDFASGVHLAGCLERLGEYQQAVTLFQRLHDVNPQDRRIKASLDRCKEKMKQ